MPGSKKNLGLGTLNFFYWPHDVTLTCKANLQFNHTSLTLIDIMQENNKTKGRF